MKSWIKALLDGFLAAPGTGKSTAAFAFSTSQLDDKAWIFTWMHFGSARVQCVRFSNIQREETVLEYDDKAVLRQYLVDSADVKKHFLFLDGYVSCGPNCAQIRVFSNECENWLLDNRAAQAKYIMLKNWCKFYFAGSCARYVCL